MDRNRDIPSFDRAAPLGGGTYHLIRCNAAVEAAAFIAAISRLIDSPRTAQDSRQDVEIWAAPPDPANSVTLYLSSAALDLADQAFAPVPVAGTCPRVGVAADARLALHGETCRAMGVEQVLRTLSRANH